MYLYYSSSRRGVSAENWRRGLSAPGIEEKGTDADARSARPTQRDDVHQAHRPGKRDGMRRRYLTKRNSDRCIFRSRSGERVHTGEAMQKQAS
jgi:hypothetical protein